MACKSCGGSTPTRIERVGTGSRSVVAVAKPLIKAPLRPQKVRTTTAQVIKPANHLDKRM